MIIKLFGYFLSSWLIHANTLAYCYALTQSFSCHHQSHLFVSFSLYFNQNHPVSFYCCWYGGYFCVTNKHFVAKTRRIQTPRFSANFFHFGFVIFFLFMVSFYWYGLQIFRQPFFAVLAHSRQYCILYLFH